MIYLTLTILSLYIFDPFKRLNGGVIGWVRRGYSTGSGYTVTPKRWWSPKAHKTAKLVALIMKSQEPELTRKVNAEVRHRLIYGTPSTYTKPEESLLIKKKLRFETIRQKPFNEGDIL